MCVSEKYICLWLYSYLLHEKNIVSLKLFNTMCNKIWNFLILSITDLLESVLEKHRHLVAATPPPSPTQGESKTSSRHSSLLLFSSSPIRSGNSNHLLCYSPLHSSHQIVISFCVIFFFTVQIRWQQSLLVCFLLHPSDPVTVVFLSAIFFFKHQIR